MGEREKIRGALLAAAIAALLAGCGGSSSTASSHSEPSAEFLAPKGTGQTAEFGEEADEGEREAASKSLEENLQARASGDWQKQCATLSKTAIAKAEKRAFFTEGCVKGLELLAGEPPSRTKEIRANTMTGPIAALRVEGDKGYALYHGTKGLDYSMEMEKEGGEWKVGSLTTTEVP